MDSAGGIQHTPDLAQSDARLDLRQIAEIACLLVCLHTLVLGTIGAEFYLIYLSFQHPQAANTLIPVIVAPLCSTILVYGKRVFNNIRNRGSGSEDGASGVSIQCRKKLESDS